MLEPPGSAVDLSDEEFHLLRDLLYDYCGIFFPDSMKFLVERRLRPRLAVLGLHNFRDYYRLLKYRADAQGEYDQIVDRVTTNETYFFREDYQLRAFTEEIVPLLATTASSTEPMRIWSAGCSSGEEPYTLAMLLADLPAARNLRVDIFGNDISRRVLQIARAGTYRAASFRQTPPHIIAKYFVPDGVAYRLRDEIRAKVSFAHLNLMDEAGIAVLPPADVVFCRNVMIYFGTESRARLLATLHRKLRPGGFLLLGHSESLVNITTGFELVPLKNDIVYRKPLA